MTEDTEYQLHKLGALVPEGWTLAKDKLDGHHGNYRGLIERKPPEPRPWQVTFTHQRGGPYELVVWEPDGEKRCIRVPLDITRVSQLSSLMADAVASWMTGKGRSVADPTK